MEYKEENIIGRKVQINMLHSLISEDIIWKPPCIFVSGPPSTGKTLVVTGVLKMVDCCPIYINCLECYTANLLFDQILHKLTGHFKEVLNTKQGRICDNMSDFIHSLRNSINDDENGREKTVCIVLDQAQRLKQMDSNILPGMVRLQELTNRKICVILISNLFWIHFAAGTGLFHPVTINFPQYNKEEAARILFSKRVAECSTEFYNNYVNLILNVFFNVCRDVVELNYLAQLHFSKYCRPLVDNETDTADIHFLWKTFEPTLKSALKSVFLRKVSSSSWLGDKEAEDNLSERAQAVELPFYSKYLLIASFIASYNAPKDDVKLFVKERRTFRRRKSVKISQKSRKKCSLLTGPKAFPLNRMLCIFGAIVDDKIPRSVDLLQQISTLVNLEMLALMKSQDPLLKPRYKCTLPLEVVSLVAKTVDFSLEQYILDQA